MESVILSPTSPNEDLIPNLVSVSASPRNEILNQSIWNYLASTSEVICLVDPCHPLKKGDFDTANLFFPGLTSSFCSLLLIKVFHLVQLLGAPFCLLVGMRPIQEPLNTANKIFKIYSVQFCFFNTNFQEALLKFDFHHFPLPWNIL